MKKSEAIQKLILRSSSSDDLSFKSPKDQWDEVLDYMVKGLGMLPPQRQEEFGTGYADDEGNEMTQTIYLNEWEEE
jgi:hypothetical protein